MNLDRRGRLPLPRSSLTLVPPRFRLSLPEDALDNTAGDDGANDEPELQAA